MLAFFFFLLTTGKSKEVILYCYSSIKLLRKNISWKCLRCDSLRERLWTQSLQERLRVPQTSLIALNVFMRLVCACVCVFVHMRKHELALLHLGGREEGRGVRECGMGP